VERKVEENLKSNPALQNAMDDGSDPLFDREWTNEMAVKVRVHRIS
jgi:hypothetical protein